jgi:homoserine kinase
MPRSAALVARLRAAGIAAVISGAGPTVLALTTAREAVEVAAFDSRWFTAVPLAVDAEGAHVLPLDG